MTRMIIGFTGTSTGATGAQLRRLRAVFQSCPCASEFHHGDCVGADAQADAVAREVGLAVVIHPPSDDKARAFCAQSGDVVHAPPAAFPGYMERNQDIVDECTVLVVLPQTAHEVQRSGTWSTVRKARRAGKPVMIITPAGELNHG